MFRSPSRCSPPSRSVASQLVPEQKLPAACVILGFCRLPSIFRTTLLAKWLLKVRTPREWSMRSFCDRLRLRSFGLGSARPPAWLEIRTPVNAPDSSLTKLDPGERDAIMLAVELRTDQLIVDDREARKHAEERRIPVIGTLAYGGSCHPRAAGSANVCGTSPNHQLLCRSRSPKESPKRLGRQRFN